MFIGATDVKKETVVLDRQVEHACRMQSSLTGQAPLVGDVVIPMDCIIKQSDSLNDELAVVGDAAADVPWMVLVKEVAFNIEDHVHGFEDDALTPVLSQRYFGDVAIAKTQLEIPVDIAVAQGKHGIEFLKAIASEATVEVAVFDVSKIIIGKSLCSNLISQVKTMFSRSGLVA